MIAILGNLDSDKLCLFPLSRHRDLIKFQTRLYPEIKIFLRFVAFGMNENKSFHHSLAVDHRLGAVSFDGFVKFFGPNAAHQPVVPQANAHLVIDHKADALKHRHLADVLLPC